MGSLRGLATRMQSMPSKIQDGVDRIVKRLATNIATSLIEETPVDTSMALSNWQVTDAAPAPTLLPPYFMGERGSTAGRSRKAAILFAKKNSASHISMSTLYITNNTPYIGDLNEGTSPQAPAGFVNSIVEMHALSVRNMKLLRR